MILELAHLKDHAIQLNYLLALPGTLVLIPEKLELQKLIGTNSVDQLFRAILWKKTTQEIIDSLDPKRRDGLKVYPDGAIANGNSRITILQERGVDVDNLPRDIINKEPVPDPIEPE